MYEIPKPGRWAAVIALLELFPCPHEVRITISRVHELNHENSYRWYESLDKVQMGAEPLSRCMTVEESMCLGLGQAQIRWRCQPGTPLLDLRDFRTAKE